MSRAAIRQFTARSGAAVVAGIVCLIPLVGCALPETRESSYATLRDAVDAGAVRRGWVPPFLPPSSTDIKEAHTLGSREIWLRFSFAPDDPPRLPAACVKSDPLHVPYARGTRQFPWWSAEIQTAAETEATPLRFFRCRAPGQYPGQSFEPADFIAIDPRTSLAWFWRPA